MQPSHKKVIQGVPKKLVRFAAKTTFINTISLIALQTAQVFLGHSVLQYYCTWTVTVSPDMEKKQLSVRRLAQGMVTERSWM